MKDGRKKKDDSCGDVQGVVDISTGDPLGTGGIYGHPPIRLFVS